MHGSGPVRRNRPRARGSPAAGGRLRWSTGALASCPGFAVRAPGSCASPGGCLARSAGRYLAPSRVRHGRDVPRSASLATPGPAEPGGEAALLPRGAGCAEPRVGDLVHPEVHERETCPEQREAEPWRHEPPPRAAGERAGVLCPVEHRAPAPGGDRADAEKGQARLDEDRVQHRDEELGGDERDLVGDDLEPDDAGRRLPGDAGCLYVVAPAKRQGLGAHDPRRPRPCGDGDHHGDRQRCPRRGGNRPGR